MWWGLGVGHSSREAAQHFKAAQGHLCRRGKAFSWWGLRGLCCRAMSHTDGPLPPLTDHPGRLFAISSGLRSLTKVLHLSGPWFPVILMFTPRQYQCFHCGLEWRIYLFQVWDLPSWTFPHQPFNSLIFSICCFPYIFWFIKPRRAGTLDLKSSPWPSANVAENNKFRKTDGFK